MNEKVLLYQTWINWPPFGFFPIRNTFYSNKTCESHICNKNGLFHFSITVTEMILKGINENNRFVDV